ncbi:MAG: electron transfer flavoprotein beta subunit/FixA family protein [Epsilonproteobacteria bacterium]|nr:MAG: electron transfer flavoprotein beta subunit/FixA family protein [Campylobacterota bacterium]
MNIFVCVKQVPDTETKVVPTGDGSYIETNSIKWILNPYDEFAVEQALQVKAANSGSTITVVRVGGVKDTEALRTAMAMGADEAILIEAGDNVDSYMTAKAIKGAIEKSGKNPDLILTGKQAIDDDCLQVPQLLAQMLGMPSVSVVVGFEQDGDGYVLKREIEGGAIEVYSANSPAVVACNKGLNTPRYPSLPGIIKAKRKPMEKWTLSDVGVADSDRRVNYSNFQLPPEKPPGKKFEAMDEGVQASVVSEVVNLLRTEAKVI